MQTKPGHARIVVGHVHHHMIRLSNENWREADGGELKSEARKGDLPNQVPSNALSTEIASQTGKDID